MSEATTYIVATTVTVTAGKWAAGESMDVQTVVGGGFVILALSVMGNASPVLANRFALLIFIAAVMTYGMRVLEKMGIAEQAKQVKVKREVDKGKAAR